MNKKKVFILTSIIVVFVLFLAVSVIYSFELQRRNDQKEQNELEEQNIDKPEPTETPLPKSSDEDTLPEDSNDNSQDDVNIPDGSQDFGNEEGRYNPITLVFAGDVNFDESSWPIRKYEQEKKGILGGISQDLIDEMVQADVTMVNNEFAYSLRGTAIPDKSYTFRANPERVNILLEMGVDIVSLANNHALDYGEEALLDTFDTLEEAGIDYVGAGINKERGEAPIYYTIEDKTIGIVAASRVIYAMDWYASDTRPGMIGTYDPAHFIPSIEEAKENSDFVVAYVHWGKENTHELLDYQYNMARQYIDAGADAVIGSHPHVLQGIEFYKGKPIAYSLGNYWFSSATRETALFKIIIDTDDTVQVQIVPAMCDNTYTYMIHDEDEKEKYFDFIIDISYDIEIDDQGYVTPIPQAQ